MDYLPIDFNKLDEMTSLDFPLAPSADSPSLEEQFGSFASSSQNTIWSSLSNDNTDGSLANTFCQNLDPNNLFLDLFSLPNSDFPSDSASPTDFTPDLFIDGTCTNNLMIDSTNWLSMSKQPFDLNDVSLFAVDPNGSNNVTGHFPPDPRFEFGNLECISSDPQPSVPFMVEHDPYSFLQSNWLSGNEPSSSLDPILPSSKRVINLKVLDHQVNELFSTQNQPSPSKDLAMSESGFNSDCSTADSISNSVSTTASASPLSTPPPLITHSSSSENARPAPYHINIRPKPAHQPILPLRHAPLQPLSQSKVPISNNGSNSKNSNHTAGGKMLKPRNKRHAHPEIRKHPNPTDASRPYQCEILGCGKNFLNKNGLRYHYQEGTCDNAPLNDEDKFKPRYPCLVPGCTRVFKSANGLSYHKSHIHFPHLLSGNEKDIHMSKLKEKDMMNSNLPQTYNSLKRKGILGGRIDGHCNRDTSLSASASGTTTIKSQHLDSIMANLAKRPLFSRHLSHLGTSSLRFASTSLGSFNFGKPSINANMDNILSNDASKAQPAKLPRLLPKPEALDVVA